LEWSSDFNRLISAEIKDQNIENSFPTENTSALNLEKGSIFRNSNISLVLLKHFLKKE